MTAAAIDPEGRSVHLQVEGVAQPAGSKRAMKHRTTGRIIVLDDAKGSRGWKTDVAKAARAAMSGPPLDGPLCLTIDFYLPRPKGHYGTGSNARELRRQAPAYPTVRPDLTKLIRAVEDALTKIVWHDDAQVVQQHAYKLYADVPVCVIHVDPAAPRLAR